MTTGEKLAILRKNKNMTQEQLADQLGVSRQAISKWESDISFPETDKLIELSTLYGCTLDYLLKDEGDELVEFDKEMTSFIDQPYFIAFCFAAGVLVLNLIFYFFPFVSGTTTVMGQTITLSANFYQLLGAPNYQFGNVVALCAFLAMFIGSGLGVISTLMKVSFNAIKVRRITSIIESSLLFIILLMFITSLQIGMLLIFLLSVTNTWVLYKYKKAHICHE